MPNEWFSKYCQKHYNEANNAPEDEDFDLFYELSEFEVEVNSDRAWQKVCEKIRPTSRNWTSYWKVAAAIILMAFGALFSYQYFGVSSPELTQLSSKVHISKYQLPDGSHLTLDRKSSIKLDEETFAEKRDLNLKGKAYFEVTKGNPFTISTSNGKVRVLGTSFDVDSRGDELIVHVYSGVVEISDRDHKTKLTKNQIGIISNNSLIVRNFSDPNVQSWRTGQFKFDNQPLKEVIPQLEDYYDISIHSSKALMECKITAQFDKQSLTEVIETLAAVLNAKSKKSGNKVSFSGKGC